MIGLLIEVVKVQEERIKNLETKQAKSTVVLTDSNLSDSDESDDDEPDDGGHVDDGHAGHGDADDDVQDDLHDVAGLASARW